MRGRFLHKLLGIGAAVFGVALAVRLFFAWMFANAITSDHGVVCLMVKHMVEGRSFPIFYYGQSYMGSLEPMVSALIARIIGLSGFAVNTGAALAGALSVLVVFVWSRRAFGLTAGIASALFLMIGSQHWCQFMSWGYGGYALLTLCSTTMLWQVWELMRRSEESPRAFAWRAAWLGVVAGVGWWTHPLILWALVASAVLLVVRFVRRPPWGGAIAGVAGFFVGSAPLWIWNVFNNWKTFGMLSGEGHPEWRVGMGRFFGYMLPALLDLNRAQRIWNLTGGVVIGVLILMALLLAVWLKRSTRDWAPLLCIVVIAVFGVVSVVLFGQSRFALLNTARYGLTLMPLIAILIGAGVAALVRWLPFGLGWSPLALLVALQCVHIPGYLRGRGEFAAFEKDAKVLGASLAADGVEAVYTLYSVRWANYGLNFLLREKFCFSNFGDDRIVSYKEAIELSENIAVLNNNQGFSRLLKYGGGEAFHRKISTRLHYHAGFRAPSLLSGTRAAWRCDDLSAANCDALSDYNASTSVVWPGSKGVATLVLELDQPARVGAVRLFSQTRYYPGKIAMDVLPEGAEGTWTNVISETVASRLYWSGPRVYWAGVGYRMELWPDISVPVRAIRLRMTPFRNRFDVILSEVDLLVQDSEQFEGTPTVELLKRTVSANGVKRLYADRWVVNQFMKDANPPCLVSADPEIFERRQESLCDVQLEPREGDAFVVLQGEMEPVVQLLLQQGCSTAIEHIAPWEVVRVTAVDFEPASPVSLIWVGWTLLDRAEKVDVPVSSRKEND